MGQLPFSRPQAGWAKVNQGQSSPIKAISETNLSLRIFLADITAPLFCDTRLGLWAKDLLMYRSHPLLAHSEITNH